MDRDELTRRLRAVFVEELEDHVAHWNAALLDLERGMVGAERADRVNTLFRIAHSLKGAARAVHLPKLEEQCHELEERLCGLRDAGEAPDDALSVRLFAAADVWAEVARRLRANEPIDDDVFRSRAAVDAPAVAPAAAPVEGSGGLRVPAARLDGLLVRSGQLTRAVRRLEERERACAAMLARLRRRPSEDRARQLFDELTALHAALRHDLSDASRVARATDDDVRQLRLTPFAHACAGLDRVVRDTARETGREAELVIEDANLEMDRSILTALRSPLVHLVRNAVVHGIEAPAERERRDKPRVGKVVVAAELRGSEVRVTVTDDGRGLDLEALAERATAQGVEAPADPQKLARLAFVPGITTTQTPDALSGRGVGLDVVKAEVEAFHGTVDVESEAGRGATFVLSAPLTRTVVRVLLVGAGGQVYAIPSTNVVTLKRIDPEAIHVVDGKRSILHEGSPVPYEELAITLGIGGRPDRRGLVPAALLQSARDRICFAVDELRSVEDVVVEGLGPRLTRVRNLAGATTLADGTLAPILHVGDLTRSGLRQRAEARAAPPTSTGAPFEPPTLLVVDDSLTTLALEKTILESAGYRVLAATDGERAMRLLADAKVDLVVSDVEMPRMSGLELTRAVRRSKRTSGVPVVLLTGLDREEHRQRGLDAGADAYLVKNAFDQTELLDVVERLLSR